MLSAPRRFPVLILTALALLLAATAVGFGVAVQAKRETAEAIKPYDPLPHW